MNPSCPIGVVRTWVQLFRPPAKVISWKLLFFLLPVSLAAGEASPLPPMTTPPLPDLGFSILRLLGALIFVVALFLGGVWLMKRWQQQNLTRSKGPRLMILDTHSLGARQALYVVAYEKQRLLVGSSPAGISLISHLPEGEVETVGPSMPSSFAAALQQVVSRKAS